jgi:hypothetical protein
VFYAIKTHFTGFAFFVFEAVHGYHFSTICAQFFVENIIVWKFAFSALLAHFVGFAFFVFEVIHGFHFNTFSAHFVVDHIIVWIILNVLLKLPVVEIFVLLVSARLALLCGLAIFVFEKILPFAVQTACAFHVNHTWVRGCINRT